MTAGKFIVILCIIGWAIFNFQGRNEENLKYDDGDPIRTGDTKNNLNHGVWTWYHENGKVQITGRFDEGKREGVWKSYDTAGNLLLESTYRNNLLDGLFIQYAPDGTVVRKEIYKADQPVQSLEID